MAVGSRRDVWVGIFVCRVAKAEEPRMDQGQGGGRSDTSPEGLQPEPRNSSLAPAPPSTTSAGDEQPKVLGKLKKWGDYCSFGNPIEGEKLLPMKTPLTKRILR